jgi:hypothetical protein
MTTTASPPPPAATPSSDPVHAVDAHVAEPRLEGWARDVLFRPDPRTARAPHGPIFRRVVGVLVVVLFTMAWARTVAARVRPVATWVAIAVCASVVGAFALFSPPAPSYEIAPDPDFVPLPTVPAPDAQAVAQVTTSVLFDSSRSQP